MGFGGLGSMGRGFGHMGIPLGGVGRRPGSSLAYALGDSRTAQNIENTINYSVRGNGAGYARRFSAGKLQLPMTNINGGSGETAATIRANRYPTAKASSAKILILLAGVNQGTSLAQDLADVTYMAQDFAASASDRITIVYDEMPVDTAAGWDATKKARHASLRDGIRALNNPAAGVYVFGSWRIATGGDDGDTPQAGFFYSADGIHPIILGGFLLGKGLNDRFINTSLVPAFDPYAGQTFAIGTTLDGANFAGSTGNAISVASLAAANVSSSRMVVDGTTTWAELTLNTTSSATINRNSASLPANVTAGVTRISAILKVKLSAGLAHCRSLQLAQIKQSGLAAGTNSGLDMSHQGSGFEIGAYPITQDTFLTLHAPPVVVDADATSVRWQLGMVPEIVGGVTQTMMGVISVAYGGLIIEP